MAFIGIQSGREALFQPQPRHDVAVNDINAWRMNPSHRRVYDRLSLALAAGLRAAPCGLPPADYGIAPQVILFVKPIINLAGMAKGARALRADQMPDEPGSFWCEQLSGEQSSSDCLVDQGEARWFAHTRASDARDGARPLYWEVGARMPHLEPILGGLVRHHLPGYSGLCNIELIGGQPVEMHLRGSNGFFDFYGPEFMPAWVALVDGQRFEPPPAIPGGYVISVFGKGEPAPELIKAAQAQGVRVQPDNHTKDRLAILRTRDLDAGLQIARTLGAKLPKTIKSA
ncbi:hypothetical protein Thiowin_04769 [Thiorhodovibrio winogradskyi]|uniref:Glyoxalase-like domain-containing protein n=1 Tax=Thiorhodovibrio winogradskyi TaxID=77007 RepID=A0ABZ0SHY4_9GAMM|nr:hypothetical protein [Thiorhodovibrio winogradskyi]